MKKIMIAALGLSLLPVGAIFAQNTTSTDTGSMKSTKSKKKSKKKTESGTTSSGTGAKLR